MFEKDHYARIARETLRIIQYRGYTLGDVPVSLSGDITASELIRESTSLTPAERRKTAARIEYVNTSTIGALTKLYEEGEEDIGILSFASAKNPGGGFKNGAMAQEESLMYASTLYASISQETGFYKNNKECHSPFYLSNAIYSPDVLFFRDENLNLLDHVMFASVVTMPAVNMREVIKKHRDVSTGKYIMRERISRILRIFASKNKGNIVIGDFGCGVFGNNVEEIRDCWERALSGSLACYFDRILYTDYGGSAT